MTIEKLKVQVIKDHKLHPEKLLVGRPIVKVNCNDSIKIAFLDTGSAATLIKRSSLSVKETIRKTCSKNIYDVSGSLIRTDGVIDLRIGVTPEVSRIHRCIIVSDLDFPGDILIGIDFLRRFNFKLEHSRSHDKGYLTLEEIKVPVKYSDTPSRSIRTIASVTKAPVSVGNLFKEKINSDVGHVRRTTVCPPRTGKFVDLSLPNYCVDGSVILVEGSTDSLLIPKIVTTVRNNTAHVFVVNDSNRPVKLKNGTRMAVIEKLDEESLDSIASVSTNGDSVDVPLDIDLSHLSSKKRKKLVDLLSKYNALFTGDKNKIGNITGIKHGIVTTSNEPVHVRQWRLPQSSKEIIKKTCKDMHEAGVIEPSSSPWMSPVVLVRKKNGDIRFCVDYRAINKITIADQFPLPRIDELIDDLGNTSYFTVLDARSAYWSISMDDKDKEKTAFSDGSCLWQFKRMPYGLRNAPATFQRAMNTILNPVLGKHALAYLDDIIIFSSSFEEHLLHLMKVLSLLKKAGIKLNLEKCKFLVKEVKFLGFLINSNGISPDPDKIKAINEMPVPKNVTDVRRILGAAGFFRRHVPNFSSVVAPLTNLTKKGIKFEWRTEHDLSFRKLKHLLTTAPVLKRPDFSLPFELHTDASSIAIGSCLMQYNSDGYPCAVAYHSRKLRGPECRYNATNLEALAVVESVRHFDAYLFGRAFTIYTDHKPLTYIFSKKTKCYRMSRWSHELSDYVYRIIYKKGSSHHVPDLLSRNIAAVDITNIDSASLREQQLSDPLWSDVIGYLEGKSFPKRKIPSALDEFELADGLLYHLKSCPDKIVRQLVVPKSLHNDALKIAHNSLLAAHPGVFRTYCKLKQLFYFQNMLSTTKEYVRSCLSCQQRKGSAFVRASLSAVPEVSQPLDRVSADLMDLHSSYRGNRYVLSIVDHMSRYLQLIPLPNKDAETVANAFMENFVTLFGVPRMLTTDNGSEFKNRIFTEVCDILKTKLHFTTPFHPQSNGLVERTNRCVKDCLAILCRDVPLSWDEFLPFVRYALNTGIHRAINNQPIYLFMGHDSDFPVGLTNQLTMNEDDSSVDHFRRLTKAREIAVEASSQARESYAKDYNKKVRPSVKIDIGSLVLRRAQDVSVGSSRSLNSRWLGPSRVIQKTSPVTFVVKDINTPYKEQRVHINQLKSFYPTDEVTIVSDADNDPPNLLYDNSSLSSPLLAYVNTGRTHSMKTRSQVD